MTWIALVALIGWTVSVVGWRYCYHGWKKEREARLAQQQRVATAAESLTRPERRIVKP